MNPELRGRVEPQIDIGAIDFENLPDGTYDSIDEQGEAKEAKSGSEELQEVTEISKKLIREEEAYLVELAKKGNKIAEERLIIGTQYLVESIARRYMYRGLDLDDLIQEGNIGLTKAIKKFNPEKGFRLTTYAAWWIRAWIQRALDEQGRTIRFPVYIKEELKHVGRTIKELAIILERQPEQKEVIAELAERRRITKEKANEYLDIYKNRYIHSLNEKLGEEEKVERVDLLAGEFTDPEKAIDDKKISDEIRKTLTRILNKNEKIAIEKRFLEEEPWQFKEIGQVIGVSKQRAKQIQKAAIEKMRRRVGHTWKEYLETL